MTLQYKIYKIKDRTDKWNIEKKKFETTYAILKTRIRIKNAFVTQSGEIIFTQYSEDHGTFLHEGCNEPECYKVLCASTSENAEVIPGK